jgi:hypothetical protein
MSAPATLGLIRRRTMTFAWRDRDLDILGG